jgi:hypothetical protein
MVVLESIGLVLGIAPLIIELLKAKPEPVYALLATSRDNAYDLMEEFYGTLSYELSMLKMSLLQLVNELPIAAEHKEKLLNDQDLDQSIWKNPPEEIRVAMEGRLSACHEPFVHSMEKILHVLAKIVDDKRLPIALDKHQIVSYLKTSSVLSQTRASSSTGC